MKKIKLLDEKTINKIAAGEVIERPVAVVKELIENSIDALSTEIVIEVKKGGISYIRVTDNGLGINSDEIEISFLRHSTSKISKIEDLENILTLGFRGEALSSIAAVSRLEMISKNREEKIGRRLVLFGGEVRENTNIGTKNGTTIIVKDLFFNTPVRKEFLKSEMAENMAINDFLSKIAMSNPGISFTYINNGKTILKTPGKGNIEETIYSVMGRDFIDSTFYFERNNKNLRLKGYISNLKYYRGNRMGQIIYVNGRIIRSLEISKAIEEIYKEKLPIGKFPNFVIFIDIDPSEVDVNIHPTKMEIRFKEEKEILGFIKEFIKKELVSKNLIPEIKLSENRTKLNESFFKKEEIREQIPIFNTKKIEREIDYTKFEDELSRDMDFKNNEDMQYKYIKENYVNSSIDDQKIVKEKENNKYISEKNRKKDNERVEELYSQINIIGISFDTYIICENRVKKELFLIDQHAAHERILYEEFKNRYKEKTIYSQDIMGISPLELSLNDMIKLEKNKDSIERLGFKFDIFGENSIIIRAIPLIFDKVNAEELFLSVIDNLTIDEDENISIYELKLDKIMKKACTSAIKGGDKIENIEIKELIKKLFSCKNPYTCPHGRPITLKFKLSEIEKHFSRIQ